MAKAPPFKPAMGKGSAKSCSSCGGSMNGSKCAGCGKSASQCSCGGSMKKSGGKSKGY